MPNETKSPSGPIEDFQAFIGEAKKIIRPHDLIPTTEVFWQFISAALPLLKIKSQAEISQNGMSPGSMRALAHFAEFTAIAVPVVIQRVQDLLPTIRERVMLISRWLIKDDLLAIAGFGFAENAYTELLAWALHPDTHLPSAVARQRAWLSALRLENAVDSGAAIPETQVWTNDGILDLVLRYASRIIIVEAKTGTGEHATPSGGMQTISYVAAIDAPAHVRKDIVFITADGSDAANSNAITTTFAEFAVAMAATLEGETLPLNTRLSFSMLITHLITWGNTLSVSVRELLGRLTTWATSEAGSDSDNVLKFMPDLILAIKLFGLE